MPDSPRASLVSRVGDDASRAPAADEEPEFVDDGRAVFYLEYHLLMVTRRRRSFFRDEALRERTRELLTEAFEANGCTVECMTIGPMTVRTHFKATPHVALNRLVTRLRQGIAPAIQEEFPRVVTNGGLFVRRYIISVVETPETACDSFVESLPTR